MPWVLRIAHVSTLTAAASDSQAAMADISRGLSAWKASLNRGLLPDDEAIQQLVNSGEGFTCGHTGAHAVPGLMSRCNVAAASAALAPQLAAPACAMQPSNAESS